MDGRGVETVFRVLRVPFASIYIQATRSAVGERRDVELTSPAAASIADRGTSTNGLSTGM